MNNQFAADCIFLFSSEIWCAVVIFIIQLLKNMIGFGKYYLTKIKNRQEVNT